MPKDELAKDCGLRYLSDIEFDERYPGFSLRRGQNEEKINPTNSKDLDTPSTNAKTNVVHEGLIRASSKKLTGDKAHLQVFNLTEIELEMFSLIRCYRMRWARSPRRPVRSGSEYQHLTDLNSLMKSVSLFHSCERWICDLSGDGEFRVKRFDVTSTIYLATYESKIDFDAVLVLQDIPSVGDSEINGKACEYKDIDIPSVGDSEINGKACEYKDI
nr:RNA-directed DNA polymerase, eukaryota [Tanacetum cinerariifolium]